MKTTLLAKSSSGEHYKVEFAAEGNPVRVFCHCQAGILHRMCKHKLALIKGDTKMLFEPSQAALLSEIHSWSQFAHLKTQLENYETRLKEVEAAANELAKKAAAIKTEFARGLTFGFKPT